MTGIARKQWALSGIVWWLAYNFFTLAAWFLVLRIIGARGFHPVLGNGGWKDPGTQLHYGSLTLLMGLLGAWMYVAIRPRYGAGPISAIYAGVALWVFFGLFPAMSAGDVFDVRLLAELAGKLVVILIATLCAGYVYKEDPSARASAASA